MAPRRTLNLTGPAARYLDAQPHNKRGLIASTAIETFAAGQPATAPPPDVEARLLALEAQVARLLALLDKQA